MQIHPADPEQFPPDLEAIAAAILDGTPVDWTGISADADPELVAQLRVLAGVVSLHQSLSDDTAVTITRTTGLHVAAGMRWGPLTLIEPIGQGAFGQVFRAWDTRLDREVALKLLRAPDEAADDAETLIQEGRLLARIRHSNIVTVYGAERIDGRVGIWTEFIHGRTLTYLVKEHGRFSAYEAGAIGIDLCRALSAVHAAGLLHRDVKAQNVMREQGGRIVLMDFGTGKERPLASAQAGHDLVGTPLYTAPELWRRGPATPQSDIYSLGVLLFYLVSGGFPVQGASMGEIRDAHRDGRRSRLRDIRPDTPDSFIDVVERALAPNPSERFETAGAFEAALKGAQHSLARARRPRPLMFAAVAAAVLVAAAIAGTWGLGSISFSRLLGGGGPPVDGTVPAVDVASTSVRQLPLPPFRSVGRPSRDGRFLPYTDIEGDLWIWTMATETSQQVTKKTDATEEAASSLMSPDGSRVAFAWRRSDGFYELRVVEADGRWSRVILPPDTSASPAEPTPLEWSRDGQQILYHLVRDDGTSELAVLAADGGARTSIASFRTGTPRHATLSPNGLYVVFDMPSSDQTADRDLMIARSDASSPPTALLTGPFNDLLPSWTPDGNNVFFVSDRSGTMHGWLLPMSGGQSTGDAKLVARNLARTWPVGLTDTGAYFYGVQVGAAEVYVATVDVQGGAAPGTPAPVSESVTMGHLGPAWSPDGTRIAYVALKGQTAGDRDSNAVLIQDVASSQARSLNITALSRISVGPPRWSPDARQLLVRGLDIMNREGLYAVDAETGALISAHLVGQTSRFHWSADGRSILYGRGQHQIIERSVATGSETVLFDAAAHGLERIFSFALSPDGRAIAMGGTMKDSRRAIFVFTPPGGLREIHSGSGRPFMVQAWTPDAQQILFTIAGPQPHLLMRIAATGGTPVDMGLPIYGWTQVNWLSLSPDGTRIAYTVGEPGVEVWMMDNFLPR